MPNKVKYTDRTLIDIRDNYKSDCKYYTDIENFLQAFDFFFYENFVKNKEKRLYIESSSCSLSGLIKGNKITSLIF